MHDRTPQILFNFSDLGWDRWCEVHPVEMEIIWHGAQDMLAEHDERATRAMLALTKARLIARAARHDVTEEWITTALLCAAMDGQLDGKIPRHAWM